jgi:hypothetical protein
MRLWLRNDFTENYRPVLMSERAPHNKNCKYLKRISMEETEK